MSMSACTLNRNYLSVSTCVCSHTHTHTHLHTVVTDAAVRAARRPVEVTGGAPLHPNLNALDLHILVERRSEIIVLVLVLVRCGETHTHTHTNTQRQTYQ